jgi:hypothetical protein
MHAQTPERLIESVENLARRIIHTAKGKRAKVRCTEPKLLTTEIQLTVFEFQETE